MEIIELLLNSFYMSENKNSHEDAERSRLEHWARENRPFHEEKQKNVTSSLRNWFAFDTGDGVITHGVNTCVAIVGTEPGFIGHIAADRKIPDAEFRSVVFELIKSGVKTVYIFGMNDDLFADVHDYLKKNGFIIESHRNYDQSSSFTVQVKNGKINYFNK